MSELSDDPQSLSQFIDFINNGLDLSNLGDAPRHHLTDDEIEQVIMPLIRSDINAETLRAVDHLLRQPQPDYWRAQLAPFHREIRECLAPTLAGIMQQRFPGRLSDDQWLDVAVFVITIAWLVRKQMDSDDDPLPSGN